MSHTRRESKITVIMLKKMMASDGLALQEIIVQCYQHNNRGSVWIICLMQWRKSESQ